MNAGLKLHELHLPPVGWWPPAPGWWALLGMLVALAVLVLAAWLWRRRSRLRRAALAELDALQRAYEQHRDGTRLAADCSALLRRLSCLDDAANAGLTGQAWLQELQRQADLPGFAEQTQWLLSAPYSPQADVNAETMLALCRRWIGRVRLKEAAC